MAYKTRQFVCAGCEQTITHNTIPTRKYCSKECYLTQKRNPGEVRACGVCKKEFLARVQQVNNGWGKYCSRACYFTVPNSEETRRKKAFHGKQHWNWKGGIMKGRKDRNLAVYRNWRLAVFARDRYTCQECGIRNGKGVGRSVQLEADHIESWTTHPKLRYEVSNGRTLCRDCHSLRTAQQHRERMSYATI